MRKTQQWFAAFLFGALVGCGPQATQILEFGPSDVETIDVYLYDFGSDSSPVMHAEVTDRREIAELVSWFTDQEVESYDGVGQELDADRAAGLRFMLRDGSSSELTQVFASPLDVVVFWPDGTASKVEHANAISDYYPSNSADLVPVESAERPEVRLP